MFIDKQACYIFLFDYLEHYHYCLYLDNCDKLFINKKLFINTILNVKYEDNFFIFDSIFFKFYLMYFLINFSNFLVSFCLARLNADSPY